MMERTTHRMTRTVWLTVVAAVTLANLTTSLAQQRGYGLYIGDRDTNRVITYLHPLYDASQTDPALSLRWSCAYSQFARGYQNNPLQQVYIYGIAIDARNRRVWASDHTQNRIVAFDSNGNYITHINSPAANPRKMTIGVLGQFSYLYFSAGNSLWVYGPLENLNTAQIAPFIVGNQQLPSASGVRFIVRGNNIPHLLISDSGGVPKAYRLSAYNQGILVREWTSASPGEDIDYIDDDNILLAINGNPATIVRLSITTPNPLNNLATNIPGTFIGIAVGPTESDGTRLVYVATYGTQPNAVYVYKYAQAGMQRFNQASPLPFKSGYAIAIGPLWDCTRCTECPEDVDRNGVVDDADLLRVLFAFGTNCGN